MRNLKKTITNSLSLWESLNKDKIKNYIKNKKKLKLKILNNHLKIKTYNNFVIDLKLKKRKIGLFEKNILNNFYGNEIKLIRRGRYNKPYYHIVVTTWKGRIIDHLGTYDPHGLFAYDYENGLFFYLKRRRILFWIFNLRTVPSFFCSKLFELVNVI
jgi:ribosomal protein S16